jgi:WD40 repeat protein
MKIAFDAEGKRLVSGDKDGNIMMWNLDRKPPVAAFLGKHTEAITNLVFSTDGQRVFASDTKGRDRLRRIRMDLG